MEVSPSTWFWSLGRSAGQQVLIRILRPQSHPLNLSSSSFCFFSLLPPEVGLHSLQPAKTTSARHSLLAQHKRPLQRRLFAVLTLFVQRSDTFTGSEQSAGRDFSVCCSSFFHLEVDIPVISNYSYLPSSTIIRVKEDFFVI